MSPAVNLEDYDYNLPEELIAQHLAKPRDSARLLMVRGHGRDLKLEHAVFSELDSYLTPGDVLVLNNTRVTKAKLIGKKATGSPAEVVLTRQLNANEWQCRIKTKHPRPGARIAFSKGSGTIIAQDDDHFIIQLSDPAIVKAAVLPTPPYITRGLDDDEYQTIYAQSEGSLAAPTAGLHFTQRLLSRIEKKGVTIISITLQVSYGTFKKIDSGVESYVMEPEQYEISRKAADAINRRKGRLVVVGTTALKTLESSSHSGKVIAGTGMSELFIYPPYPFQSGCDVLITNFHLPKSTLILLTSAFGGRKRVMEAYREAIAHRYRFYSLGDAMMIEKKREKEVP